MTKREYKTHKDIKDIAKKDLKHFLSVGDNKKLFDALAD